MAAWAVPDRTLLDVKMEAEATRQGQSAASRSWKGEDRKNSTLPDTLILAQCICWASDLENWKTMNLCCFKPKFGVICHSSNRKLTFPNLVEPGIKLIMTIAHIY